MTRQLALALAFAALAGCGKAADKAAGKAGRDAGTVGRPDATPAPKATATPVEIVLVNKRAQAIYVDSANSCWAFPVTISEATGSRLEWRAQHDSCDDVRKGNCRDFGECADPGVFKIEAGASFTFLWDGRNIEWVTLKAGEGCSTLCTESVATPPGSYVFEASAYSACTKDCGCAPAAEGNCQKPKGLALNPDLTTTVEVQLPAARAELVFQ